MEINLNGENFVFAGNIFKCERFSEAIIIKCRHVQTIVVVKGESAKLISNLIKSRHIMKRVHVDFRSLLQFRTQSESWLQF